MKSIRKIVMDERQYAAVLDAIDGKLMLSQIPALKRLAKAYREGEEIG